MKIKTIMYEINEIRKDLIDLANRLAMLNEDYLSQHAEKEQEEEAEPADDMHRSFTPEERKFLKEVFTSMFANQEE